METARANHVANEIVVRPHLIVEDLVAEIEFGYQVVQLPGFRPALEDSGDDEHSLQFQEEVTARELFCGDLDRVDHRDRHRLFDLDGAIREPSNRDDLQFPRAEVRRPGRVQRQAEMPLDRVAGPALVDALALPNCDTRPGAKINKVRADEGLEPNEGFGAVHSV